jgi:hypothetical protein
VVLHLSVFTRGFQLPEVTKAKYGMSGQRLHLGHGPIQWVLDHVNENNTQSICEVAQAVRGCVLFICVFIYLFICLFYLFLSERRRRSLNPDGCSSQVLRRPIIF